MIFAMIDEPRGEYYGGEVAAPLFREILNAVANRYSLPTPAGTVPSVRPVLASDKPDVTDTVRASQAMTLPVATAGSLIRHKRRGRLPRFPENSR